MSVAFPRIMDSLVMRVGYLKVSRMQLGSRHKTRKKGRNPLFLSTHKMSAASSGRQFGSKTKFHTLADTVSASGGVWAPQ